MVSEIDNPGPPPSAQQGRAGAFESMDARALLSQDLFNPANIRSRQSYRSRRESSRLPVEDAREIVALNLVSAYLEALRSKATRDTLTEHKNLADELYKITRDFEPRRRKTKWQPKPWSRPQRRQRKRAP